MHIPDGYLSPQTYIPFYVVAISIITVAVRRVKKELTAKLVPFLGMSAAFAFLIMMFNIPVPGGTRAAGHHRGSRRRCRARCVTPLSSRGISLIGAAAMSYGTQYCVSRRSGQPVGWSREFRRRRDPAGEAG